MPAMHSRPGQPGYYVPYNYPATGVPPPQGHVFGAPPHPQPPLPAGYTPGAVPGTSVGPTLPPGYPPPPPGYAYVMPYPAANPAPAAEAARGVRFVPMPSTPASHMPGMWIEVSDDEEETTSCDTEVPRHRHHRHSHHYHRGEGAAAREERVPAATHQSTATSAAPAAARECGCADCTATRNKATASNTTPQGPVQYIPMPYPYPVYQQPPLAQQPVTPGATQTRTNADSEAGPSSPTASSDKTVRQYHQHTEKHVHYHTPSPPRHHRHKGTDGKDGKDGKDSKDGKTSKSGKHRKEYKLKDPSSTSSGDIHHSSTNHHRTFSGTTFRYPDSTCGCESCRAKRVAIEGELFRQEQARQKEMDEAREYVRARAQLEKEEQQRKIEREAREAREREVKEAREAEEKKVREEYERARKVVEDFEREKKEQKNPEKVKTAWNPASLVPDADGFIYLPGLPGESQADPRTGIYTRGGPVLYPLNLSGMPMTWWEQEQERLRTSVNNLQHRKDKLQARCDDLEGNCTCEPAYPPGIATAGLANLNLNGGHYHPRTTRGAKNARGHSRKKSAAAAAAGFTTFTIPANTPGISKTHRAGEANEDEPSRRRYKVIGLTDDYEGCRCMDCVQKAISEMRFGTPTGKDEQKKDDTGKGKGKAAAKSGDKHHHHGVKPASKHHRAHICTNATCVDYDSCSECDFECNVKNCQVCKKDDDKKKDDGKKGGKDKEKK